MICVQNFDTAEDSRNHSPLSDFFDFNIDPYYSS